MFRVPEGRADGWRGRSVPTGLVIGRGQLTQHFVLGYQRIIPAGLRVWRSCDYWLVMVARVSNFQFFVRLFGINKISPSNLGILTGDFGREVYRRGNIRD